MNYLLAFSLFLTVGLFADEIQVCTGPSDSESAVVADVYSTEVLPSIAFDQNKPAATSLRPTAPVTNFCPDLCACAELPAHHTYYTDKWCRHTSDGVHYSCQSHFWTDCIAKTTEEYETLSCRTCGGID
jgi:hypothetical protein